MKFYFTLIFFCIAFLAARGISVTQCEYQLGGYSFNLCPFSTSSSQISTVFGQNLLFNIGDSAVQSCQSTQAVWATFTETQGVCLDVATEQPSISFQDSTNPDLGGINIAFPVVNSNNGKEFQLNVQLNCDTSSVASTPFSLPQITADQTGLVTFNVVGSSYYGCSQPVGCLPTVVGNSSYRLCAFNGTYFNVSDQLGGYLYFTMGTQNLMQSCYGVIPGNYVGARFTEGSSCYDAAYSYSTTPPSIEQLPDNDGILITLGAATFVLDNINSIQVQVVLHCDHNSTTSFADTQFDIQTNFGSDLKWIVTGSSSIACPINTL